GRSLGGGGTIAANRQIGPSPAERQETQTGRTDAVSSSRHSLEQLRPDAGSPGFVAMLLKRGDELLATGDISGARLFYERAATAGSALGAMGAGKTHDPLFLRE